MISFNGGDVCLVNVTVLYLTNNQYILQICVTSEREKSLSVRLNLETKVISTIILYYLIEGGDEGFAIKCRFLFVSDGRRFDELLLAVVLIINVVDCSNISLDGVLLLDKLLCSSKFLKTS